MSNYNKNFRTHSEYQRLVAELLAEFALKHNLKAPDLVVIASVLGILGTIPIKRNLKMKELSQIFIEDGMKIGKEVYDMMAKEMEKVKGAMS